MDHYQKIQQAYKDEVKDILDGHVIIEEKVDGSQFRIEIDIDGKITCGSHHQDGVTVDSMFKLGVEKAEHVFTGYKPEVKMTVFCEYLATPKQNAIPYARVPLHNLLVFDIKRDTLYLDRPQKELFCKQHGLEVVPILWEGDGKEIADEHGRVNKAFAEELLKRESILGHQRGFDRIEGFVVKNYSKFYDINKYPHFEGHWKCVKIVNDAFKEKNREENPNKANKFQELKDNYRSEARMLKTIQHLKEKGLLKGELSDLKLLIPEMERDIWEEEGEELAKTLVKMFGKEIVGYASKGMVAYYKNYLLQKDGPNESSSDNAYKAE